MSAVTVMPRKRTMIRPSIADAVKPDGGTPAWIRQGPRRARAEAERAWVRGRCAVESETIARHETALPADHSCPVKGQPNRKSRLPRRFLAIAAHSLLYHPSFPCGRGFCRGPPQRLPPRPRPSSGNSSNDPRIRKPPPPRGCSFLRVGSRSGGHAASPFSLWTWPRSSSPSPARRSHQSSSGFQFRRPALPRRHWLTAPTHPGTSAERQPCLVVLGWAVSCPARPLTQVQHAHGVLARQGRRCLLQRVGLAFHYRNRPAKLINRAPSDLR
jgi:hypothetical protein